jgi:hypothetical protein
VKVRKRDFPLVGLDGGGYDEYSPKSDLIPLSKLSDMFPKSYALQTPPILGGAELAIPAGMKLTGRAERNSIGGFAKTFISLENDFVDLELAVTLRGGVGDIGIYSLVTQVPVDEFSKVWTARYLISMKATLKAYRSGHPDMPKYRAWVDNVFETVREHLDSQREWERKDRETHQDLQTQLGAKIDKVDKAILGLQDKNDAILQELARLKGNR